jgi:single-strand selective monofunctional uracil DNA glycosylase
LIAVSADQLVESAVRLRDAVNALKFAAPVSHVYNPLDYAWAAHEQYLRRYGNSRRRVLFLGMNPGPFGMMQVGVPFGEIAAVRGWMGINAAIQKPDREHPKRPIQGFDCTRSEVSGQRLWGLFSKRFDSAKHFFKDHIVINYCPLVFLEESGRNRTPDKLLPAERTALYAACNTHLKEVVRTLQPEWIVGVGDFAAKRAEEVCGDCGSRIGRILHPSPASPAANRDWAGQATAQLKKLGIWV